MIDPNRKSLLPFGTASLVFLAAAMIYQWWPAPQCEQLEEKMQNGYFLRWLPPQLMLITADQKSLQVEAEDKQMACKKMIEKINQ